MALLVAVPPWPVRFWEEQSGPGGTVTLQDIAMPFVSLMSADVCVCVFVGRLGHDMVLSRPQIVSLPLDEVTSIGHTELELQRIK